MPVPSGAADATSISLLQLCQISYLDPSDIPGKFPLAWPASGGGSWSLAWGPAQDPSQGNLVYVAVRSDGSANLALAVVVRGTDWRVPLTGLWNQIVEDLDADSQQAPPWTAPTGTLIAAGTAQALTYVSEMSAGGQSLVGFLTSFYGTAANQQVPLQVTGHSLGGCVTTVLAPWLQAQLGQQKLSPTIVPTTYAAPSAGNQAFAEAFRTAFPTAVCYRNSLDIVPKAMAELYEIPLIYANAGPGLLAPISIATAIFGYAAWLLYCNVSYADIPDSQTLPGAWLTPNPNDPLGPWADEALQQHATTTYMTLLGGTSVTDGEVTMLRQAGPTSQPRTRTVSGDPAYAARLRSEAARLSAAEPGSR